MRQGSGEVSSFCARGFPLQADGDLSSLVAAPQGDSTGIDTLGDQILLGHRAQLTL